MARLEHQHIVQVFSETVDPDFNQRLLCMQLVPGIGLDKLIGMLHARAGSEEQGARSQTGHSPALGSPPPACDWTGAELLELIDRSGSLPTALDPSALHDREALGKMDAVEATAWFGARLAEALDFAHRNGVLHRDIKPANILVNPYGRPMLADFNISSQPVGTEASGEELFGGTFAYMSPEHLDAFNPGDATGHEAVTARSDMYSLGLVLQQLFGGPRRVSAVRSQSENGRHAAGNVGRAPARLRRSAIRAHAERADDAGALDRPLLGAEPGRSVCQRGRIGGTAGRVPAFARSRAETAAGAESVSAEFCGIRFCGLLFWWCCRKSLAASSTSPTT